MTHDVIVIGAGAAGMMCAAQAGQRGRRVLLIEHAPRVGERIRISGGGRCNFTNRTVGPDNFLSRNPHFARSALTRYTPAMFLELLGRHRVAWEERDHGQLFCRESAQDIIDLLMAECEAAGVQWAQPCEVQSVAKAGDAYKIATTLGTFSAPSLVVATGGLAVPKLGATPLGYKLAEQFGLAMVPPRPALVPLALRPEDFAPLAPLAGVAFEAVTGCHWNPTDRKAKPASFRESALITHRGLSGPAILQVSSYWQMQPDANRSPVEIDLLPGTDAAEWLASNRRGSLLPHNLLAERLPRRFAQAWCEAFGWDQPMGQWSNAQVVAAAESLNRWRIAPSGTLGYAKAEVTLGGVDTGEVSSKTMEAKRSPGLYFIGEVLDVTGWLGGYNFQWAWSSGWVAGQFA